MNLTWSTIRLTHRHVGGSDLFLFYTLQQVCHMVFALQGFTKEFIAMDGDGIGVEYLGKTDNEARDI